MKITFIELSIQRLSLFTQTLSLALLCTLYNDYFVWNVDSFFLRFKLFTVTLFNHAKSYNNSKMFCFKCVKCCSISKTWTFFMMTTVVITCRLCFEKKIYSNCVPLITLNPDIRVLAGYPGQPKCMHKNQARLSPISIRLYSALILHVPLIWNKLLYIPY